ncbi:MAG TPA: hypothetical protein VMS65_10450 [Polyangiaceae bacterium]|nr:hypothetical protein [Polyangiaceae bacterium]
MLARHLPLLWTFAGGCLSGAALLALWPGESETTSAPKKQRIAQSSETLAPPIATSTPPTATTTAVRERALPDDSSDAHAEPTHTEPGSSVADVLVRLETAYRQGLSAAPEVPAPLPPRAEPAVALPASAPAPAPTAAPELNARPVVAPEAERGPVLAARDEAQPSNVNVHVGDNNQTTHVGDVVQGNVILVQAPPVYPVYGYPQVFAPPPQARGGASLAYTNRGMSAQFTTRGITAQRAPTFASSWTVPNDRLGYDSALVPMLK